MGNGTGAVRDAIVRRRFGPGQPDGTCADERVVVCAKWECCRLGRCELKPNVEAEEANEAE